MKQAYKYLIAASVVFIVLLAMYAIFSPDKPSEKKSKTSESEYMSFKKDPTLEQLGDTGFETITDDAEQMLEFYKKWSQYPPFSRPLHKGQVDLTDPYNPERPAIGIISVPASQCSPTKEGGIRCEKPAVFTDHQCKLTPEKSISVGKKDFHVFLSCNDQKGQLLPITKIVPKVYTIPFRESIPSLPVIHFGDDGTNGDIAKGDNQYTFLLRPTSNDWGDMFLEVDMEIGGKPHNQRATWYSTPIPVAEFKSGIRDSIKDGSLVVTVPVNILKKGYYHFDANIQGSGEDKDFVATSSWEGDIDSGAQKIDFQFFGKIIKDSRIDGPYLVREIRGKRNNSPVTPSMVNKAMTEGKEISGTHKEPLWEYLEPPPNYTTSAYQYKEFSGEEWNSKEKEERLQFLEKQVKSK
ncbi:MAG: hypothetical protein L6Q54_08370 [Leptospiraceae bacterium]|nr:hypothetical protein [Leptospiraceae bacterium]MCK6381249.1 hypothetical protein [Leptospiraceae bacterium]NUM41401.1 hypothetical protein [Leptospiraceae bacterium]